MTTPLISGEPDPLESNIGRAHDIVVDKLVPPRSGIVPEIRLGNRWFNVLWLIPIGVTALILAIAIGRELRTIPLIEEFIRQYPGHSSTAVSYQGFPLWVRLQHLFNL